MPNVVFVGDKPSRLNKYPEVAFVGTKSYKTLLCWIADMNVDIHKVKLINKDKIKFMTMADKFVVLGNEAEKAIKKFQVEYFKLPHPSGANLKNNDKVWLKKQLQQCQRWLEGDSH